MDKIDKNEFKKAWYLAYARYEPGVNPPNWNGWNNEMIERVAKTIPAKYWEQAKAMTSNEAFQVYENHRRLSLA